MPFAEEALVLLVVSFIASFGFSFALTERPTLLTGTLMSSGVAVDGGLRASSPGCCDTTDIRGLVLADGRGEGAGARPARTTFACPSKKPHKEHPLHKPMELASKERVMIDYTHVQAFKPIAII